MAEPLRSAIVTAQAFFRSYAAEKKQSSGQNALTLALHQVKPATKSTKDLTVKHLVDFCLSILSLISSAPGESDGELALGSKDLKTIDALVEVAVWSVFFPMLKANDFSMSQSSISSDISDLKPLDLASIPNCMLTIGSLLKNRSRTLSGLKRHSNLSLLIAGVVCVDHKVGPPAASSCNQVLLLVHDTTNTQQLLMTLQALLLRQAPTWALARYKSEMTTVLIRPGGLQHVTTFLLRPDDAGNIPLSRFDQLAALVAAVPIRVTTKEYMLILSPQLSLLFRDSSTLKDRHRRAAAAILHKLISRHKDALSIIEHIWAPLKSPWLESDDPAVQSSLEILNSATAFENIRQVLLSNHTCIMLRQSYSAQLSAQLSLRDQFQRLLFRQVEDDPDSDLVSGLDEMIETHQFRSIQHIESTQLMDPSNYFLRSLDDLRLDGRPIQHTLRTLIRRYSKLSSSAAKSQYLYLMLEIPSRFKRFFANDKSALEWMNAFCDHFNKNGVAVEGLDDISIVYTNILKLLSEDLSTESIEQRQAQERVVAVLKSGLDTDTNVILQSTLMQILPRFELSLLRHKSVSAATSAKLPIAPRTGLEDNQQEKIYASALDDLNDEMVPNRAHGLYLIGELAKGGADVRILHLARLMPILLQLLAEEEPFVHHNATKALKKLITAYGEQVKSLLVEALQSKTYAAVVEGRIRIAMTDTDMQRSS